MSNLKNTFDPRTAPPGFQKLAFIGGVIFTASMAVLNAGLELPSWAFTTLTIISVVSGAVAGYPVTRVQK